MSFPEGWEELLAKQIARKLNQGGNVLFLWECNL